MRQTSIEEARDQETRRAPTGAPPLSFEIAFVLGCLAAALLLYGRADLINVIAQWFAR